MRETLRLHTSSDMTTKWGVLLSSSATHSTHVLFFLVRLCSFNRFRSCTLRAACGDHYAGITLIKFQLLTHHLGSSSELGSFLALLCILLGFLPTVVSCRGPPNKWSRFRVVLPKVGSFAALSISSGIWATEHLRRTTPRCYQFPSRNLSRFWDLCTQRA